MKNIEELRDELSKVLEKLKNGEIEPFVAKEINNTAARIIDTTKVQLANAAMRNEKPDINFLKVDETPQLETTKDFYKKQDSEE